MHAYTAHRHFLFVFSQYYRNSIFENWILSMKNAHTKYKPTKCVCRVYKNKTIKRFSLNKTVKCIIYVYINLFRLLFECWQIEFQNGAVKNFKSFSRNSLNPNLDYILYVKVYNYTEIYMWNVLKFCGIIP